MWQYSIRLILYAVLYYVFNYAFNIQLIFNTQRVIQYSTSHSTFNYSFNSFEPSLFLVSDTDHCLLQTWRWRRLECWLRKKKLMKVTQASTSMWSLPFQGFLTRFFKELTRFLRRKWMRKLWSSILSLSIKRCVCFVYPGIPWDSSSNINAYDKETLDNLSSAFSDVDQPCSNV